MINLDKLKEEYTKIANELSLEEVLKDNQRYAQLSRRFAFLERIINLLVIRDGYFRERKHLEEVLANPTEDEEVKNLAKEELENLLRKIKTIEENIEDELFSEDEPDRDVIIEIRAAAGGEEAALFAADLFKMYAKYIEKQGWKSETLSSSATNIKGFKEVIFSVKGKGAYSHLKFESGVHRVQRVPITEAGGRIHTSTVTVAVLFEPKEIELKLNPEDLRIETFRASGHGGQHVQKTESAVRITHLPTGIVASCQDERSQLKNREKAMRVLKIRLLEKMEKEETEKTTKQRRVQIGTGERSEKIRTYNFPECRVTDHRINLTVYQLEQILEGQLDEFIRALMKEERAKLYELKGLS